MEEPEQNKIDSERSITALALRAHLEDLQDQLEEFIELLIT